MHALGQALPSAADGPWRKQARLLRHLTTRLASAHSVPERPGELNTLRVFDAFRQLDPALAELRRSPAPPAPPLASIALPTDDPLTNALHLDRVSYLPQDILALTDQTAMRHGLEVRTPYLDQDLTNFASQIPVKELLRHGPKWMLRELLNQRGGQAFTKRSKEGFGLPLTRWLRMPKPQVKIGGAPR